MPKYTDPGFEKLTGAKSVSAETWNAQNGIMISYGANRAARFAFQYASRSKNRDGSVSYINANEGSSTWLNKARRSSIGLNIAALGLIDALNSWDDRSREVVTSINPLNSRRHTTREWRGELRFKDFAPRERMGLAAPFATEPFALSLPDEEVLLADALSVIVHQVAAGDFRTRTTLNFNGGEATYGIEADGLIVPGRPFGFEQGQGVVAINQTAAQACFGGLLNHITHEIGAETAR